MAEVKIQGAGPYKMLDEVDCRCLDQICSNCRNRNTFFTDMAELGLPVEEYQAENQRILGIADALSKRAFPGPR